MIYKQTEYNFHISHSAPEALEWMRGCSSPVEVEVRDMRLTDLTMAQSFIPPVSPM